jgi:glycosyltransferase involved in cell wall biosynthesis
MKPILSVIICTHNPKINYLERVLQGLKEQTLQTELWELLLIDNASDKQLASEINLSWHPQYRHIREEKLGLTPARLRGIQEATGEILVFVDDDNILYSDYLEIAFKISKDFPIIGAWGGQITAEFEEIPPEWTKPYWWMLAIRELERDAWSNLPLCYDTVPLGAGMCVRKVVAQKYAESISNNSERFNLDVKGKELLRGGDIDLALTSCDLGLGNGLFVSLKLTHLIPKSRLQEEYLLKLCQGIGYSQTIMEYYRGKIPSLYKLSLYKISEIITLLKYLYFRRGRFQLRDWRFFKTFAKGRDLAIQKIFKT